jgi:hypothetical protein
MPGQIGQITMKAVAFIHRLAKKRQAAPAKAMPNAMRRRRSRLPASSYAANVVLASMLGFERADRR